MTRFPSEVFRARITRVRPLSRDMVRIGLAGPGLTGLAAPAGDGADPVLDAYLKILVPHPSRGGRPVELDLDQDWRTGWFATEPEQRGGWMRTYTLRAARPWRSPEGQEGVEVDVDFVLHGEAGKMGPGAAWAAGARPGDEVSFIGPDREGALWTAWNPGRAERALLCADETALPAAGSVLRSLPGGFAATLLVEVPEGNEELEDVLDEELLPPPAPPGAGDRMGAGGRAGAGHRAEAAGEPGPPRPVAVHWLHRRPGEDRGAPTLRALREVLDLPAPPSPGAAEPSSGRAGPAEEEIVWQRAEDPEGLCVWLAAEAGVVRAARRICVSEAGIPKQNISFMGYWRAGRAEG